MRNRVPGYKAGFYSPPRGGIPKYPQLWRGCIGAWSPLLGNTGSRLIDQSILKNHGTLNNMDLNTDWTTSGGKTALYFDGTNNSVSTSLAWPSGQNSGVTFSFWTFVASADSGQLGSIGGFGASAGNGERIQMHCPYAGVIYWDAGDPTASGRISVSMTGYYDRWVHVVGTSQSTFQAIYLDGKVVVSKNSGVALTFAYVPNTLGIGLWDALYHKGHIDDFRIYSRAISQSEIKLLANHRGIAFELEDYRAKVPSVASSSRRNNMLAGMAF